MEAIPAAFERREMYDAMIGRLRGQAMVLALTGNIPNIAEMLAEAADAIEDMNKHIPRKETDDDDEQRT